MFNFYHLLPIGQSPPAALDRENSLVIASTSYPSATNCLIKSCPIEITPLIFPTSVLAYVFGVLSSLVCNRCD
ncbi:hypothetical protein COLO4_18876 [Corchorus olitorius]|uniref:Uncharacterized protein n=1 Tax=Corchorus olitorius TaxID=93759 RepID=A0A1R3J7G7_9ROSI|nr:hypothetical protein COLO4_18876 [Corchorus olitorius]